MTPEGVVEIGRQALWTLMVVSAPMLIVGLVVGLGISIFQAATQINEMTMTFVPKIVAVLVVALVTLPWVLSRMISFTEAIFEQLLTLGAA